jgi:hypothetical protein
VSLGGKPWWWGSLGGGFGGSPPLVCRWLDIKGLAGKVGITVATVVVVISIAVAQNMQP